MFREDKTTQLAAYLIQKEGGRIKYLKLMKMLYDADREMLVRYGTPITFDAWCSMKKGPVLSRTLNNIKEQSGASDYWPRFIKRVGYEVTVLLDPGDSALSDAEIELADEAYAKFGHLDQFAAAELSHDIFPEWKDPGKSSKPITYRDVLRASGIDTEADFSELEENLSVSELLCGTAVKG